MYDKRILLQHIENRQRTVQEQIQRATNLDELKMPEINKYGRYVHRAIRKASDRGAKRAEEIGTEHQSPDRFLRPVPSGRSRAENEAQANWDREAEEKGKAAAAQRENQLGLRPGESPSPGAKNYMNTRADRSFNRADKRKYRGSDGGIQSTSPRPWVGSGYADERRMREAENEESRKTGIGRAMEKSGLGTVHDLGREIKRGISLAAGIER
jgi:hypothetical protein